jgi:integrase
MLHPNGGMTGLKTLPPPLRRPALNPGRTRRVSDDELSAIKELTASADLPAIIDIAVETAMRLSEIVSLPSKHVDLVQCTVLLPDTKNGRRRIVPLSSKAVSILESRLPPLANKSSRIFPITPHAVTTAFRRAVVRLHKNSKGQLGENLRLHDLRHEAVSRFFERGLNVIEVAAISGHRSIQMLARYSHLNPSAIAQRLTGV